MSGWADMESDLLPLGPMTLREKVTAWAKFYWWPTRGWLPKIEEWWLFKVRRWPEPPPFDQDRLAQHFGWVDGVEGCEAGPGGKCLAHDWLVVLPDV